MINELKLIQREKELFRDDLAAFEEELGKQVMASSFLVVGGAGSIGQAVVKEIFKREPQALHVVDISENNLVELVRDIRSSLGYIEGDFKTFALDCGSPEFELLFLSEGPYDYVLNLSALKHVRSEKDPYTLMRMIEVNILNNNRVLELAEAGRARKFFCVSTDKATNPVNMMGASKRIMEMFLLREAKGLPVSTARFANVAFSDGSLLHGFNMRLIKGQPLAAPDDVKRYFITSSEAGELCLLSCLLGESGDIFFPKLREELHLISFEQIAVDYLEQRGFEAVICETEAEARARVAELSRVQKWPCYFFSSDTTGEKDLEEFYSNKDLIDTERFSSIGVIKDGLNFEGERLDYFLEELSRLRKRNRWSREDLIKLVQAVVSEFTHRERGKFLDGRM